MNKITITDRYIYSLIKSYSKNDKPFFASNEYISKQINRSQSVISHSISRLLKLGYLENKGNKMVRSLFTKKDLEIVDFSKESAENSKESAENSKESAENSINIGILKREFAENSNNQMLKSAIESAENSNILIKILIKYTNIKEYKEKISFENEFEEFYNLYPKKINRKQAYKSFLTAIKKDNLENILLGLENYKQYLVKEKNRTKIYKTPSNLVK